MTQTRTSVVLDPDVAKQRKALARQRNVSFKTVLNNVIRWVLQLSGVAPAISRYRPDRWA
jgi:hypothetical protein